MPKKPITKKKLSKALEIKLTSKPVPKTTSKPKKKLSRERIIDDSESDVSDESGNSTESDADSVSADSVDLNSVESDDETKLDNSDKENMDEVDDEDKFGDNGEINDEDENEDDVESSDLEFAESDDEIDKAIPNDDGDDCMYRFNGKKTKINDNLLDSDVDAYDADDIFADDIYFDNETYVKPEDRITKPNLTKYERVRAICDRARQIASGAKPMIDNVTHLSPKEIAKLELEIKKMPLYIDRILCTDQKERWDINELNIVN